MRLRHIASQGRSIDRDPPPHSNPFEMRINSVLSLKFSSKLSGKAPLVVEARCLPLVIPVPAQRKHLNVMKTAYLLQIMFN
ncbi:hypothetical protein KY289_010157 [Solanum tuberosum]|nr:hypothetical protein KY289_010157 [Solanum tuberosum]